MTTTMWGCRDQRFPWKILLYTATHRDVTYIHILMWNWHHLLHTTLHAFFKLGLNLELNERSTTTTGRSQGMNPKSTSLWS